MLKPMYVMVGAWVRLIEHPSQTRASMRNNTAAGSFQSLSISNNQLSVTCQLRYALSAPLANGQLINKKKDPGGFSILLERAVHIA